MSRNEFNFLKTYFSYRVDVDNNSNGGRSSRESDGRGQGRGKKSQQRGTAAGSEAKTTRVRTVLNEKQLNTLRTCYSVNPRPDTLLKEQLVEMTGLSSRVIRVWFQNKRCKDKKRSILIRQLQHQQHQKHPQQQHPQQQHQQDQVMPRQISLMFLFSFDFIILIIRIILYQYNLLWKICNKK